MVTLNLLGTFQLLLHEKPIILTSAKAQALLVYLALTRRSHSRLALSALLWPEKSDAEARTNLRQALYAIRRLLPGLLVTSRETIGLAIDKVGEIDAHRFEDQARFGLAGDIDALRRAAQLYQGDFLEGFHVDNAATFEEWMLLTKEQLHKLAFQVLQQITAYYVANQDSSHGLRFAEQWLHLAPWHEEAHYQLMQLLAWSGQRQAALAQFSRCQQLLAHEFGTEPSTKTLDLAHAIQQGQVKSITQPIGYISASRSATTAMPEMAASNATSQSTRVENEVSGTHRREARSSQDRASQHRSLHNSPSQDQSSKSISSHRLGNLPHYLSSFVGRSSELAELHKAILPPRHRDSRYHESANDDEITIQEAFSPEATGGKRLVTLVGPGGVGKTRLALRLAAELQPHFPHGIWFIDLATVRDVASIPQVVADILDIHENPETTLLDTLCTHLANKAMLLLLDNCEHLIKGCAVFVQQLLGATSAIQVITTSREPLYIHEEMRFPIAPLRLPTTTTATEKPTALLRYEGIRLFVDRATAISPNFALTEQNQAAVITICRMLDGLPLATELVAARTRLLTVEQIAEHLCAEPMAQLRLAAQVRSDRQPRHRTLRSLIEWSYQLLPPAEQLLLQRLTVFVGSFSFAAVEQICVDDRSRTTAPALITREGILDYLEGLVDKSLVMVEPVGSRMRYRLLEGIHQFALEKLIESGEEAHMRTRHLHFYVQAMEMVEAERTTLPWATWRLQVQAEMENIRSALTWATTSSNVELGLRLTNAVGDYWFTQGYHRESTHWIEQFLAITDETIAPCLRLRALSNLEFTYWWILEEYTKAQQLQQEALRLAQELGDQSQVEKMLNNLGGVAVRTGDYGEARAYLHQSLALSAESGHEINHAWSYILLGETANAEGDYEQAKSYFEEAVRWLRPVNAHNLLAYPVRRLGQLAQRRQDYRNAVDNYRESLQINAEVGQLDGKCASLVSYALLWTELDEFNLAIRLCAVVNSTLHSEQVRLPFFERSPFTEMVKRLETEVGHETFSALWQTGSTMSIADAMDAIETWQRSKRIHDTHRPKN